MIQEFVKVAFYNLLVSSAMSLIFSTKMARTGTLRVMPFEGHDVGMNTRLCTYTFGLMIDEGLVLM